MATRTYNLLAPSPQDLETMTMSYIAQGYSVANKTPMQVTMIKRKEFSAFWAVIGFLFCVLPLLIYLIVYALESDHMVTITVAGAQPTSVTGQLALSQPLGPFAPSQPLTSSGAFGAALPANFETAPRSPDGLYWWDGQAWQLVPQARPTNPGYQTYQGQSEPTNPGYQGYQQPHVDDVNQ
jgi:hypothetical protein